MTASPTPGALVLRVDRRRRLRHAAAAAVVAAACGAWWRVSSVSTFLWCAIAGAASAAALALHGRGDEPAVVLDAAGLDDRRAGKGVVPWASIRAVRCASLNGGPVLLIDLVAREQGGVVATRGLRASAYRFQGLRADLYVPLTYLAPGPEDVLAYVRAQAGGPGRVDPAPPSWRRPPAS